MRFHFLSFKEKQLVIPTQEGSQFKIMPVTDDDKAHSLKW